MTPRRSQKEEFQILCSKEITVNPSCSNHLLKIKIKKKIPYSNSRRMWPLTERQSQNLRSEIIMKHQSNQKCNNSNHFPVGKQKEFYIT